MNTNCSLLEPTIMSLSLIKSIKPEFLKLKIKLPNVVKTNGKSTRTAFVPPEADGEGFWATIEKYNDKTITVKVNNDLLLTDHHGVKCDDILEISAKNVLGYI